MSSLGDVVHALPAVTDASRHGFEFDWVVEEAFADIPAAHPAVSRVLPIAWRRWRKRLRQSGGELNAFFKQVRASEYDYVLDAQGLIKSAVVTRMARGVKQGFSHTVAREPFAAFAYAKGHRVAKGQHAVDRQRQLFAQALGYELPSERESSGLEGSIASTEAHAERQVWLLHGTTWNTKHWPVHMWQSLARSIQSSGYTPVVTWGNEAERVRAEQIAQADVALILPRMPLQTLLPKLSAANAVIGVDSGLAHLSAALGVPTVGLYGPTDGVLTGVRGQRTRLLTSALSCAPCLQSQCRAYRGEVLRWQGEVVEPACFAALTPDQAWQSALALMEAA